MLRYGASFAAGSCTVILRHQCRVYLDRETLRINLKQTISAHSRYVFCLLSHRLFRFGWLNWQNSCVICALFALRRNSTARSSILLWLWCRLRYNRMHLLHLSVYDSASEVDHCTNNNENDHSDHADYGNLVLL